MQAKSRRRCDGRPMRRVRQGRGAGGVRPTLISLELSETSSRFSGLRSRWLPAGIVRGEARDGRGTGSGVRSPDTDGVHVQQRAAYLSGHVGGIGLGVRPALTDPVEDLAAGYELEDKRPLARSLKYI